MAFSYDYMPRAGQKAADTPAGKVTNHGTTASAGEFDIPNTGARGIDTLSVAWLEVRRSLANPNDTVVTIKSPQEIADDPCMSNDPYAQDHLLPAYRKALGKHFNDMGSVVYKNCDPKLEASLLVRDHNLQAVARALEGECLAPAGFAQAVATAAQASEAAHQQREAARPAPRSRG